MERSPAAREILGNRRAFPRVVLLAAVDQGHLLSALLSIFNPEINLPLIYF